METYTARKQTLIAVGNQLAELAEHYGTAGDWNGGNTAQDWSGDCQKIVRRLTEETLRVAVVGTIKSGKSTLINSWLGRDYLKRGAGVVTSIVTRVRKGDSLSAKVRFKNWDEVNRDIDAALVLFPSSSWRHVEDRFDIRRDRDREDLAQALATLNADQLITEDTRNVNSVYLQSYLTGYDSVREFITSDMPEAVFSGEAFYRHRDFVGDEIRAVFVKDMEISIPDAVLEDGVELADCQGSDAPNPLHIAQVQDYLLKTHLIVYVVSSRTGIRQADLRFLNMIRKMGILDQILFVLNTDFSEHEDLTDMQRIAKKVEGELGLLRPGAQVYSFSALYRLLSGLTDTLSERNRMRLTQWESDPVMRDMSLAASHSFDTDFQDRLTHDRSRLMLVNHAARLQRIAAAMENRCRLDQDLLKRNRKEAEDLISGIRNQQARIDQVQSLIRTTIDGSRRHIDKDLRGRLDQFFDATAGEILPLIVRFIREYRPELAGYRDMVGESGFSMGLYHAFQDFKQALDTFMTETIHPEIIGMIREMETDIADSYQKVAQPYVALIGDALREYCDALAKLGLPVAVPELPGREMLLNGRHHADQMGLSLPPALALTRYSARLRTEGQVRFGFYNLVKWVRRAFRKPEAEPFDGSMRALADSLRSLRKETEKNVVQHFTDYRETLKFQYVLKLAEGMGRHVQELLDQQFSSCVTELGGMGETAGKTDQERQNQAAGLVSIMEEAGGIGSQVAEFLQEIRMGSGDHI